MVCVNIGKEPIFSFYIAFEYLFYIRDKREVKYKSLE